MSNRTSIDKTELNRLKGIELFYLEMVKSLQELANDPEAIQTFSSRYHDLNLTINRRNGRFINWSE
jgi:hypothetical protein